MISTTGHPGGGQRYVAPPPPRHKRSRASEPPAPPLLQPQPLSIGSDTVTVQWEAALREDPVKFGQGQLESVLDSGHLPGLVN